MGPTASGKTSLAIAIAKQFHGEIINADARQVYTDFNIGTGKPSEGAQGTYRRRRCFLVEGIPHYLMDFLPPSQTLTVVEWREKVMMAIHGITSRGHLPMVVGGTGLYVRSLVDNYQIPPVPPQPAFRSAMEAKLLTDLSAMLVRMDPDAAHVVDLKNRRRVLRALEVVTYTGKPFTKQRTLAEPDVDPLLIASNRTREELHARIDQAVESMVERGWIDEVRRLHGQGIAWDAPAMTSIGYRELGAYVRGETALDDAIARAKRATKQYAKRQMTWFRQDPRIHWVSSYDEATELVKRWNVLS